jgi:hypothetical protein
MTPKLKANPTSISLLREAALRLGLLARYCIPGHPFISYSPHLTSSTEVGSRDNSLDLVPVKIMPLNLLPQATKSF